MDLFIKPEYIDKNGNVKFITETFETFNYSYDGTFSYSYDEIINIKLMPNDKIIVFRLIENRVIKDKFRYDCNKHLFYNVLELSSKIDKLTAHVSALMIAGEALPKDFDGEFP